MKAHQSKYYPVYTKWSIAGTKRSHAEIEAQIYRDNPDLMLLKFNIDDHYNVIDFVKSLMRSLDSSRSSTVDAWKDSKYS